MMKPVLAFVFRFVIATVIVPLLVLVIELLFIAHAQQPPLAMDKDLPDPGPNRVEVRFAIGKKAVTCKRFHLVAKESGQILFHGSFHLGFEIPQNAENLPRENALELEFKCGEHHWHFTHVPERAFLHGWWWVGTDYPPFHELMRSPNLEDAIWMRYLKIDPSADSGFYLYKACPAKLKDQKPGPCYDE
jgi:hypothetical protein